MKETSMIRALSCLLLWALFAAACSALVLVWRTLAAVPSGDDFEIQSQHLKWLMAFGVAVAVAVGVTAVWGTRLWLRREHKTASRVRGDA
jgi:hypothetical protein